MLRHLWALWNVPHTLATQGFQLSKAVDDLAQEVRDLQATIKTHWTEEPPQAAPTRTQGWRDPHGL